MNLRKLNKGLKQEYETTFQSEKPKRKRFYFRWIALACVALLFVVLIGEHIGVGISNQKLDQKVQMLQEELLDTGNKTMSKINSKEDLQAVMNFSTVANYIHSKSLLTQFFELFTSQKDMNQNVSTGVPSEDIIDMEPDASEGNSSYETNIQTIGLDEADAAKCDGVYIYALQGEKLSVYDLVGKLVASTPIAASSLYVYDSRVICLASNSIRIYSIIAGVLTEEYMISYDQLMETRLKDNLLYMVVGKRIQMDSMNYENVYYSGCINPYYSINIIELNLDTKQERKIEVLNSSDALLYASQNNFYIVSNIYYQGVCKSLISIIDKDLNPVGVIQQEGTVLNQYSMDEYNGNIRVVSTNRQNKAEELNRLCIYSLEDLSLVGSITKGIGLEYQIVKSVRFDKDICYVVTYENTDPLYEIDCSNPSKPVIVSAYQSPGYSSYLHDFEINGGKYVLGIGYTDDMNVKISIYKNDEETIQIGLDLIILNSWRIVPEESNYYRVDNLNTSFLSNPRALFIYTDNNCLYLGMMVGYETYTVFKIDVENENEVVSVYKEYEVFADATDTRGFLVNGIFYIPKYNGILMDSWA